MKDKKHQETKIFYGWFVIAGLFVIAALGPMGRYILTALFPFIMKDPGWSRETIGMAFTLHFWAYAVLAFITGILIDKVGGRTVIFIGGIFLLIGLLLLSVVQEVWQLFLVFSILLAAAVSMTHFVPNTALARKWFIKKAGLATGLVTVGTVVGLAFLSPLISTLSVHLGWRATCVICAIVFSTFIMLSAVLIIRDTPESMGLVPDGEKVSTNKETASQFSKASHLSKDQAGQTTRRALGTKEFWFFFIAYSVTGIPLQGVLSHVIIWGVDLGLSPARSGMLMAALTIPSIPVRILAGWAGDRFGKKRMLIFFNIYSVAIWLFGWFFVNDSWSLLIFIILLGFAYSAPFSLFTPFLGDLYGRWIVGSLIGILTLGHGIIGGTGPYIWGWIADKTGSYMLNCPISAVFYVIVVISIVLIKVPTHKKDG